MQRSSAPDRKNEEDEKLALPPIKYWHSPAKKILKKDELIPNCPITSEPIKIPSKSPCDHTFEKNAIETWLTNHSDCPVCRTKINLKELRPDPTLEAAIASINSLIKIVDELKLVTHNLPKSDEKFVTTSSSTSIQKVHNLDLSIANLIKKQAAAFLSSLILRKKILPKKAKNYRKSLLDEKEITTWYNAEHKKFQENTVNKVMQFSSKEITSLSGDKHSFTTIDSLMTEWQHTSSAYLKKMEPIVKASAIAEQKLAETTKHQKNIKVLIQKNKQDLTRLIQMQKSELSDFLSETHFASEKALTLFGGKRLPQVSKGTRRDLDKGTIELFFKAVQDEKFENRMQTINQLVKEHPLLVDIEDEKEKLLPLFLAIQQHDAPLVRLLLSLGAEPNATCKVTFNKDCKTELTAIMHHISLSECTQPCSCEKCKNDAEILEILLADPRTEVNYRNSVADTALHWACHKLRIDYVQILINKNANGNLQNLFKQTPVTVAQIENAGLAKQIEAIIARGPEPSAPAASLSL